MPEFLFKPLYSQTGHRQFFQISTDSNEPEKRFQKGFREYLLCSVCEQLFAKWERVARCWYAGNLSTRPIRLAKHLLQFEGLPYPSLKNFWNSLLWRLSVTNVETWRGLDLSGHENELREMLLAENPGPPEKFGCTLVGLRLTGDYYPDMLSQPMMGEINGEKVASIILNSINHCYYIPEIKQDNPFRMGVIQQNGRMLLGETDIEKIPALKGIFLRLGRACILRSGGPK